MATSAQATSGTPFRIGRRVQEIPAPHRKGTVAVVHGSGVNAVITVRLDGFHPANFRPAQLRLL
jgi:hypothetical protein